MNVERIPLSAMDGWAASVENGDLRHATGRFYSVRGLRSSSVAGLPDQPIIHQPEVGVLGFLCRRRPELELLVQAKAEPGNVNQCQISPTVQATRSNYTRQHGGKDVPLVDVFRGWRDHRVLHSSLQSEQGRWFYQKRNHNIVLEADLAEEDGLDNGMFRWLSLPEIDDLLTQPNVVNMDARSVLACLPDGSSRSVSTRTLGEIVESRGATPVATDLVPLNQVRTWQVGAEEITHPDGVEFDVIGVSVTAQGREVTRWSQPMIAPAHPGRAVCFVAPGDEGPTFLFRLSREPGLSQVELAPAILTTPADDAQTGRSPRLADMICMLEEPALYDVVLSEEGGRFYQAQCRYQVVKVETFDAGPGFIWLSLDDIYALVEHSCYFTMEARSLVAAIKMLKRKGKLPA